MTDSWRTKFLGEICRMKYGKMPKRSDYVERDGYPIFTGYLIPGYHREYSYEEPEIVVVARGVGGAGDIRMSPQRAWITNISIVLQVQDPDVDKKFLYWKLSSTTLRGLRTGTAQPQIIIADLKVYPVKLPPLPIQRKIASILSAYDDLIENNLRRIKILEEMAQALYREWFVKFRFPGHEKVRIVDSPLGKIPEGWEVQTLDGFGGIITGKTPSKKRPEYYGHYMPFIKLPDMHGNIFCLKTQDNLSRLGAESQRAKTIPPNNLCVSCIGTAGIVTITSVASQTNQQINSIILRNETDLEFLYFTLVDLKETIVRFGATGATMTNLSRGKFAALRIVFPVELLVEQFHDLIAPAFQSIRNLQQRNQTLHQNRDLLLPKLISGELDVSELDIDTSALEKQATKPPSGTEFVQTEPLSPKPRAKEAVKPRSNKEAPKEKLQIRKRQPETRNSKAETISIDQWETNDVMAVFRTVSRGRGFMEREEFVRSAARAMGYRRLGPRIDSVLKGHVRAALRRRILESDSDHLRIATPSISDYETDELVNALRLIIRKGQIASREETIREVALQLGFRRITEQIRNAIKNAMRAAIRRGALEGHRENIWRID